MLHFTSKYGKTLDMNGYVRVARKEHRCLDVGRFHGHETPSDHQPIICPGDRYVEITEIVPAFQSGAHYCMACARAQGIHEAE